MSFGIQRPKGDLKRVGSSPLTAFYEGICYDTLDNCVKRLEQAAHKTHTITLRHYPMNEDIHAFMLVVMVGGMIAGNGLGSLHRLSETTTKVICEAPRYSPREVLVGVVILIGLVVLVLSNDIALTDKLWVLLILLLLILPLLRRQYRRYHSANQMLDFVKSALNIG